MYKIKTLAQRGSAFVAVVGLLSGIVTSAFPAITSANALNPLTERSLMLSSSSPGYHYLDGSGNTTYSPPGSGNNGQKTGETFSFKVSTNSTGGGPVIHAFTLQYCTTPAGDCTIPGNGAFNTTTNKSNLDVHMPSAAYGTDFKVFLGDEATGDSTTVTDWTATASQLYDHLGNASAGVENNIVTLTSATGIQPSAGQEIVIKFYASATNYITNPGSGAFFVKINDFDTDNSSDLDPTAVNNTHIVDGGVTVANVMNDSIQIQTKVLETMSFSVGTENPDTVTGAHGTCDAITVNDPLSLGQSTEEFSLSTSTAYDQISYWRLSSNSSNGAVVYYSGYTLHNTEGDHIKSAYDLTGGHTEGDGSVTNSQVGTEQFGLALLPTNSTAHPDANPDSLASTGSLSPLTAATNYANGDGTIADNGTAQFAFHDSSLTSPEPLASENTDVIHCSTGKIRYVANIAPDTPAGIYTSRINYIASPEY